MDTNTLEIRSTRRGYSSFYFMTLIQIACLATFIIVMQTFFGGHLNLDHMSPSFGETVLNMFLWMAYWAAFPAILWLIVAGLNGFIYWPQTVYTFTKADGSKYWNRLTVRRFAFPFGKGVGTLVFDRITHMGVGQSSFGRLLDTGSISITTMTFTNAEAVSDHVTLDGVDHPYQRRDEILKDLPGHEGVLVQMADRKKTA